MPRPKIICHMHALLNGKVDGIANPTSVGMRSQKLYFDLFLGENRHYRQHCGWLSGRGTSAAIMGGEVPQVELPEPSVPVPEGDFLTNPDAEFNYFAVDSTGAITWDRNTFDYFGTDVHIVELIPANASDAFKTYLRANEISYIIAGKDRLDLSQAVEKIGEIYGTDELILGGGANLNWSMVRDGLCDEISLLLMPVADGENHTNSLFEANEKYSAPVPIAFSLKSAEPLEDGSVWLRYGVEGPVDDA